LFTEISKIDTNRDKVIIVDGIGYLSHLYQYATIAFIGGGFGAGIHNILEAAAFGKPVIFGPKYQKFREAVDLINLGGAFSVKTFEQLNNRTLELLDHPENNAKASEICSEYARSNGGATGIILEGLEGR
jgi:3-deoxy-D-manno-octulosonic-acid transferase